MALDGCDVRKLNLRIVGLLHELLATPFCLGAACCAWSSRRSSAANRPKSAEPAADESPPVVATADDRCDRRTQQSPPIATTADSQRSSPLARPPWPQFTPPFPDRLELFEPPKRAASSVRRDDEHGESVELKGFVNVDQPRVVLSIDGVISPVAEGGEKYGVQVISIQPPPSSCNAAAAAGRRRWSRVSGCRMSGVSAIR